MPEPYITAVPGPFQAPTDIGHGYLYLVLTSPWVQRQLKAPATGSVIDALEPEEIESVLIPLLEPSQREALNREVEHHWSLISESISLTAGVAKRFEALLNQVEARD